jgi:hypothetical protein
MHQAMSKFADCLIAYLKSEGRFPVSKNQIQ